MFLAVQRTVGWNAMDGTQKVLELTQKEQPAFATGTFSGQPFEARFDQLT
jgi:hypothetical protein